MVFFRSPEVLKASLVTALLFGLPFPDLMGLLPSLLHFLYDTFDAHERYANRGGVLENGL